MLIFRIQSQLLRLVRARTSRFDEARQRTLSHSEMRGLPGFILLVPLMAREVQIGAILLGPQESYQVYREQELELIEDLSNEIACAIFGKQQQEERIRQAECQAAEAALGIEPAHPGYRQERQPER